MFAQGCRVDLMRVPIGRGRFGPFINVLREIRRSVTRQVWIFFLSEPGMAEISRIVASKNGARQTRESFRVASEALKTAEIVISWFDSLLRIGVVHDFGRIMAALF